MIIEEIKNIKSERSDLRKFGLAMGIIFALGGFYLLWKKNDYFLYSFIVGIAFIVSGLFLPVLLKPLQKVWMALAVVMGFIMTKVIMLIAFYGMVTPIGLIGRLCGKKFLDLEMDKKASSYWIERKQVPVEKSRYERQF